MTSRLHSTRELLAILNRLPNKPSLLLNASAIGVYGTSESQYFNESSPLGDDFLADTVKKWEACAETATTHSIRTVFCRFGIILSNKGGAFPKLVFPYRLYMGGRLGNGNQWVSWIHIEDVVGALLFIINHPTIEGPVNFTSPQPIKMSQLGRCISNHLRRPNWFSIPEPLLKIALGEMSLLITEGQHITPTVLLQNGYIFQYTDMKEAIRSLY